MSFLVPALSSLRFFPEYPLGQFVRFSCRLRTWTQLWAHPPLGLRVLVLVSLLLEATDVAVAALSQLAVVVVVVDLAVPVPMEEAVGLATALALEPRSSASHEQVGLLEGRHSRLATRGHPEPIAKVSSP